MMTFTDLTADQIYHCKQSLQFWIKYAQEFKFIDASANRFLGTFEQFN